MKNTSNSLGKAVLPNRIEICYSNICTNDKGKRYVCVLYAVISMFEFFRS